MWQGEYQVEVTAGEQFCFAVIEPLFLCQRLAFGAMPIAARVVSDLLKAASIALLHMTAQRSGSAYLDMVHDL